MLKNLINKPCSMPAKGLSKQKGASTFGVLFVILFTGFILFLAVKLVPPYLEFWRITKAMDRVATTANIQNYSKAQIVGQIDSAIDFNSAYVGVDRNLDKMIRLSSRGATKLIRLKYESVIPFFYNFSALLDFEHESEIIKRVAK